MTEQSSSDDYCGNIIKLLSLFTANVCPWKVESAFEFHGQPLFFDTHFSRVAIVMHPNSLYHYWQLALDFFTGGDRSKEDCIPGFDLKSYVHPAKNYQLALELNMLEGEDPVPAGSLALRIAYEISQHATTT